MIESELTFIHTLMKDPRTVLGDSGNLPKVLSYEMARITTWRWAMQLLSPGSLNSPVNAAVGMLSRQWPLPVGKSVLQSELAVLHYAMPFPDREQAGCVLTMQTGSTRVEFFGLVGEDTSGPSNIESYLPAETLIRVSGPEASHPQVSAFMTDARNWWATLQGKSINGRRRGSKDRDEQYYGNAMNYFIEQHGIPPSSLPTFCGEFGIPLSSAKRDIKLYFVNWPVWRNSFYKK